MNLNDNIGGYRKIEFAAAGQIQFMQCHNSMELPTAVSLKAAAQWVGIPFQYGTGTITCTPAAESAGTVYNTAVTAYIPAHLLTGALASEIENLLFTGGVVRYTTHDGETYLAGCLDFPLRATIELNHPGKIAGLKCAKLTLSGKSSHSQRKYVR